MGFIIMKRDNIWISSDICGSCSWYWYLFKVYLVGGELRLIVFFLLDNNVDNDIFKRLWCIVFVKERKI